MYPSIERMRVAEMLRKQGFVSVQILNMDEKTVDFLEWHDRHRVRHKAKIERINGDQLTLCVEEFA